MQINAPIKTIYTAKSKISLFFKFRNTIFLAETSSDYNSYL